MSQDDQQTGRDPSIATTDRAAPRRWSLAVVAAIAIAAGVSACGDDDDDASQTIPGGDTAADTTEADGATTSRPSTTVATTAGRATTTRPGATTTRPGSTSPAAAGTTQPAATTEAGGPGTGGTAATTTAPRSAPAGTGVPAGTEPAGTDGAGAEGTEAPAGTAAGEGTVPPTTDFVPSGPTTTGPECEYAPNDEFPIQRCDSGPAVRVIQSILQVLGYNIGTVDSLYGDQTTYAVVAFQENEQLNVDGAVGPETWAALNVPSAYGNDANGNGAIEPNEIDLPDG